MPSSLEEEFQRWYASSRGKAPAVSVKLLRTEDEGSLLVLGFARSEGDGGCTATVSLAPVEGASFFVEALEEPAEEIEDWMTDVNGYLSEKPRFSLGDAIEAMIARAPKSLSSRASATEMEQDDEDDEDEDQAMLGEIEAAEARHSQREAYSADQRWDTLASSSASQGSRQASQVLMREMRNLMSMQGGGSAKAVEIEMVDDSLYNWEVKMHADGFPRDCALRGELHRFGAQHRSGLAAIIMDVRFPDSYPMAPPFIRVVRPRFHMHTGHVTIGGSVCMQLLTPSGWLPSVALETVFVAIRSEMVEGGGRIDLSNQNDYTEAEAKEAFNRVADRYGWKR